MRQGFALLMTLVLVLIAGTVLTGIARLSMTEAMHAQSAEEELQRRWAVRSMTATLLPRAEQILDDAEGGRERLFAMAKGRKFKQPDPVAQLQIECRLAGLDYRLVVSDEQAKVNVNRLVDDVGPGASRRVLLGLVRNTRTSDQRPVPVRLRPVMSASARTLSDLGSFGQVFERTEPGDLMGPSQRPGASARVTCWGDGKMTLRRVPKAVLHGACDRKIGRAVIRELLVARGKRPYASLGELMKTMDSLDDETQELIQAYLKDDSSCHGLWIEARGRARSWYSFAIGEGGGLDKNDEPLGLQRVTEMAW